jgi:uncharacterized membrane protein (UPF0127 family)
MKPRLDLRWCRFAIVAALCIGCATQADPPVAARPAASETTSTPAVTPAAAPVSQGPRVLLERGGEQPPLAVKVEVADEMHERQRGLMFREHMDADAGMIFLFERPQQLSFWMHNTLLPLDMIFIRADMTILGVVENATPRTDDPRQVPGMSQYVLEVNAGYAQRHGVRAGQRVRFEGIEGVRQ